MTNVNFSLNAAFDRQFFWREGNSVRYLVARLRAHQDDDPKKGERAPLNIALVIDASGSMSGGRLEAAKAAALGLAERLTERDRLTLVSFASDVQVHIDAAPVTAQNLHLIRNEIFRLQTRGSTCLSGGWFAGVASAARIAEEDARMTPRVILLSDGHANEGIRDRNELWEHATQLRARGVLTSALGIGDGYDEQLLRGIAENGGGRLHDAELTSEISSVLLGELDDIFGTIVEEVQVTSTAPQGVRVDVLGKEASLGLDGTLVVPVGPIQNGTERTVVFKVTCPSAQLNDVLTFSLSATGRAVSDATAVEAKCGHITLVAADGRANTAQSRDTALSAIVARTWSAQIIATAAKMNRDNAYEAAQDYTRRELLHFHRYVKDLENGGQMIADLEMLADRVGRAFSPRMSKELTLQSALAMEERVDRRGPGKASWSARMTRGD